MKRFLFFFAALFFGCYSAPQESEECVKGQLLTDEELARVNLYEAAEGDFLVDRLLPDGEFLQIEPMTKAYEGALMLRLFGIDNLPLDRQEEILREFFDRIPKNEDLASIANFVVPKWFDSGKPLIFCAAKVVAARKTPAVSALTNAIPLLRKMGAEKVKKTPAPQVLYPQIAFRDGKFIFYAGDVYSFLIFPDGRVSAAKSAEKVRGSYFGGLSASEKLDLADLCLRDSSRENDEAAAKEAEKIWLSAESGADERLGAAQTLFLKSLLDKDADSAQKIVSKAQNSGDFSKAGEERRKFFQKTAPDILELAKRFGGGK